MKLFGGYLPPWALFVDDCLDGSYVLALNEIILEGSLP